MSVLLHKEQLKETEIVLLHQRSTDGQNVQKHKMFIIKTSSVLSRDISHTNADGKSQNESKKKSRQLLSNHLCLARYRGKHQLYQGIIC